MFTLFNVLRQNNVDIREKIVGIPLVMYNTKFEPILKFNSFSEAQKFICKNELYTSVDNRNFYRLVKEACKNGNKAYGYRWQLYNDLICDNKIFCTKYDKEKYLDGGEITLVKGYFICKNALNEVRGFRGKKLNRECTQIKHNSINTVNGSCMICGRHISRSTTGYCISCSQVVAKGKPPKPSKEELKALLDKKIQTKEIAEIYDRSPSTVSTWIKQYGLK